MAYVSSDLRYSATSPRVPAILAGIPALAGALATALRKRWIYHRTLAELQGYSLRSLEDIGARRGIEDFARRAAGL